MTLKVQVLYRSIPVVRSENSSLGYVVKSMFAARIAPSHFSDVVGWSPLVPICRECRIVDRSRICVVIQDTLSTVMEVRYCVVVGAAGGVVCVTSRGSKRYRLLSFSG